MEIMELVFGPLSLPTVGTIFNGCSHLTNPCSSVKLECSEYGTLYRIRLPFCRLPLPVLPLAAHPSLQAQFMLESN